MRRGLVVGAAGLCLWVVARTTGSAGLHLVAVGVTLLPMVSWAIGRLSRSGPTAERTLSGRRVAVGDPLHVSITVRNGSPTTTSFLLLEDRRSPDLGRAARLVLAGIPPRNHETVGYDVIPGRRGIHSFGPAVVEITDPFALTRRRVQLVGRDEILVTPRVEQLPGAPGRPSVSGSGEAVSRNLFRTGEEFYAIREYASGDDLRRIHWPSVARTGELMIRQDESARRARATLFLDTRASALGAAGGPAFEHAVSAAASVANLFLRSGFRLRLATTDRSAATCGEDALLETLARVEASSARAIGLGRIHGSVDVGSTLAVVLAVPASPEEVAAVTRVGSDYGNRIAVLVHPRDPGTCEPAAETELHRRATAAERSLARCGWAVAVVAPGQPLVDVWKNTDRTAFLARNAG